VSRLSNSALRLHWGASCVRAALRERRAAGLALDAVLSELLGANLRERPPLCVAVADACAQIEVVPGDFACASERQLDAIASACIAEVQGESPAAPWVRWQLQADQQHLLIASIAEKDIATLLDVAASHRLRVQSIQPAFFLQWNAWVGEQQPGTERGTAVFATLDEGFATVAFAQQGIITALSSGPCATPEAEGDAVDTRSHRLLASIGQEVAGVDVFVLVARDSQSMPERSRWTARPWTEDSP
jgi:hypothetical protein